MNVFPQSVFIDHSRSLTPGLPRSCTRDCVGTRCSFPAKALNMCFVWVT